MITASESDVLILSLIVDWSILAHVSMKIPKGLIRKKLYGMMLHTCGCYILFLSKYHSYSYSMFLQSWHIYIYRQNELKCIAVFVLPQTWHRHNKTK